MGSINKENSEVANNESFFSASFSEDEIDLRALFRIIWDGKYLIAVVTAFTAACSIIYAIKQPNVYESEVLLSPVEQEAGGAFAGLAGKFGGLAGLAGINLDTGGNNKTQIALEVLKSRAFTSTFIKKHKILPELMAVESWNMNENALIYDREIYDSQKREWIREVEAPFKPEPSMQEAYKAFSKILNTSTDKETGMVRLSIQHLSPYISQQWVSWLVKDINQTMKERDVAEAKKSTVFLKEQLKQTEVADIREVLYNLIEEQTKTMMFADVRDEYVFKTIDRALVPEEKVKPKRALIAIMGAFIGVMFGMFLVFIKYFLR